MVADINKDQISLDAPLAQTPLILTLKVVLVSYSPNSRTRWEPNLKLLASVAAEISRGSQVFSMFPYPRPR